MSHLGIMTASKNSIWIEEWAKDFSVLGVLGFLFATLIFGKILHDILEIKGKFCAILVVPTCVIGGCIGCLWFFCMDYVDHMLTADLNGGLVMVKNNLVNFLFASFILGKNVTSVLTELYYFDANRSNVQ